jgi:hypothetical protein
MLTTVFPPEPARVIFAAPPAWLHTAEPLKAPEGAEGGSPGSGAAASSTAELVLVFASTTEVLNAEDRLEADGFNFRLIPVPKEINPNCGLALSFSEDGAPDINRALAAAGFTPLAAYRRLDGEFRPASPDFPVRSAEGGLAPSAASRPEPDFEAVPRTF